MDVRAADDGSTLFIARSGLIQSFPAGGGVVHHARRGIIGIEFAEYVITDCRRAIERTGQCVLMVDGYEAKMHTTEFREVMTDWFRQNEMATVHMLIRSRMLEMALNVANLMLGGRRARAYHSVDEWETAGRRALSTFRRRPLITEHELERFSA